jgi:predicted HTH transcriptional regulator
MRTKFIIEVIKIDLLPHHAGFTAFVIVSDKQNHSAVNELLPLIHMKIIQVDYDHAESVLIDIAEGKTAYEQVISKDLESEQTEESKEDILLKQATTTSTRSCHTHSSCWTM